MQVHSVPSPAHWLAAPAPAMQLCPAQVPGAVVQIPVLPGITLVPRQTQVLPNCAQVVVPTWQAPPQTPEVVVVTGRVVVVTGWVVVVGGGAGQSPWKLKGLSCLIFWRLFLPILPWETQFTQCVGVQFSANIPGAEAEQFLLLAFGVDRAPGVRLVPSRPVPWSFPCPCPVRSSPRRPWPCGLPPTLLPGGFPLLCGGRLLGEDALR